MMVESLIMGKVASRDSAVPLDAGADFFTHAEDMLCVASVDGYFKTLNPAWSLTLGHTTEELLAQPYLDFVHPDDRDATIAEASKIASGSHTVRFRNRYRCKDGHYKWLSWTATPAMLDGAIYASARDVTSVVLEDEEREARQRAMSEREALIRSVLAGDGPSIVFQPIVAISTGSACGYEALSRFKQAPQRPPDHWFADAEAVGLSQQLELRAVSNALSFAYRIPDRMFVSMNVSPATLLSDALGEAFDGVDAHRLVVEVTEHAAVVDYDRLKGAVHRLRGSGTRLAIDDAGAGYSGLNQIVQLLPEFIKLDLFLTRDIDKDAVKRALAAALVRFADDVGASLIAEGVETAAELEVLHELGVSHAQGYYLGRPAPLNK